MPTEPLSSCSISLFPEKMDANDDGFPSLGDLPDDNDNSNVEDDLCGNDQDADDGGDGDNARNHCDRAREG